MVGTPPEHLKRGQRAEDRARRYLKKRGLKLVTRNYRSAYGEIDLIMCERDTLVFVEVRFRKSNDYGNPAETITIRKQARLRTTAEYYLLKNKQYRDRPCRFDVLTISGDPDGDTIHWYPDAF